MDKNLYYAFKYEHEEENTGCPHCVVAFLKDEIERYRTALENIAKYKKKTDHEDDYQSIISIMCIAEDILRPTVLGF